jgi:hypothetical protein
LEANAAAEGRRLATAWPRCSLAWNVMRRASPQDTEVV